ncbi:MAG: sigma-70 family RNA polymerase sigma factor [Chthonomonadetes bacterium]|nr:sigma-70 family RNA polymerase sigma factor [Chthonomonadetes bacterium]
MTHPSERDREDEVWLEGCARGEPDYLRLLMERHGGGVLRFLERIVGNRSEAEELLTEVFLKVWQHAGRFGHRGLVRNWIYTIAANLARDVLRRRKVREPIAAESLEMLGQEPDPAGVDPLRETLGRERSEILQRSIDRLHPTDRMLIVLYHFQENSLEEIEQITGIPRNVAKSRLFRARRKLRDILISEGFEAPNYEMSKSSDESDGISPGQMCTSSDEGDRGAPQPMPGLPEHA